MDIKETVVVIVIGTICTETGGFGNKGTSGDHPNYYSDLPEYWEESWRLEETWYNSNSGGKTLKRVKW